MQKPIDDFKDYVVEDVLGHIEAITTKRMFGGYCLYYKSTIFALITSDSVLYFKVDDTNRDWYKTHDSKPFVYDGYKDKSRKAITMPYWRIDETMMENHELMSDLVHESAKISRTQKKVNE